MASERHTCGRCGLSDDSVLDLDTGGAYHRELFHCITKLRQHVERLQLITTAERERDEARRERDALRERVQELEAEEHTADHIINLHGKLLTEIANAIKGEPEPLSMHSHHDLPELVNALVRDLDAARREREEALDQLAAAHDAREKASVECARIVADINERLIESRHRAERAERERDQFASMLHDCENERDGWKHRAERAEAEASYIRRAFRGAIESDALAVTYKTVGSYRAGLLKTINALDTTPTPEARDARGDA